jgi:hypothetical protein
MLPNRSRQLHRDVDKVCWLPSRGLNHRQLVSCCILHKFNAQLYFSNSGYSCTTMSIFQQFPIDNRPVLTQIICVNRGWEAFSIYRAVANIQTSKSSTTSKEIELIRSSYRCDNNHTLSKLLTISSGIECLPFSNQYLSICRYYIQLYIEGLDCWSCGWPCICYRRNLCFVVASFQEAQARQECNTYPSSGRLSTTSRAD